MPTNPVIGTVIGTASGLYAFRCSIEHEGITIGDYLVYKEDFSQNTEYVIARISSMQQQQMYPSVLFASRDGANESERVFDPDGHARVFGFPPIRAVWQVDAVVVGVINDAELKHPRRIPQIGTQLKFARVEDLVRLFSLKQYDQSQGAHIGSLLAREKGKVPVVLDVAEIRSTHLAILASTGSGKSYLLSVILEEMMHEKNRASILLFDPHGEYRHFGASIDHLRTDKYAPVVRVWGTGTSHGQNKFQLRTSSLEADDLLAIMPTNTTEKMGVTLKAALKDVRKQQRNWRQQDLMTALRAIGAEDLRSNGIGVTVDALLWRLQKLWDTDIFSDTAGLSMSDLCRPGQCSILCLDDANTETQQLIVASLLRRLLDARIHATNGKQLGSSVEEVRAPVFVALEEAHRFAPAAHRAASSTVVAQILGEGRKFGIGVALVSQRPGKIDSDVLSQCNTQCIMRIVNQTDLQGVANGVEAVGKDLLAELPSLSRGQALVSGRGVRTAVLCRVRQREAHQADNKSQDRDPWLTHFDEAQAEDRQRMSTPPSSSYNGRAAPATLSIDDDDLL